MLIINSIIIVKLQVCLFCTTVTFPVFTSADRNNVPFINCVETCATTCLK